MRSKILIIDDSKTVRVIVKNAFRSLDCDLLEAENGAEGLACAARHLPDLILLDLTMPVLNGAEVFRSLKSSPTLRTIPILLLVTEGDRRKALQSASVFSADHVRKPLDGSAIAEKVRRLLNLHQRPAAAVPRAPEVIDYEESLAASA